MKIDNSTLYAEAVEVVARHEHMSTDYVSAFYSKQQIMAKCRQYNDEYLNQMDTIRSWW